MRKGNDFVVLVLYVILWIVLLVICYSLAGCGEGSKIRKTNRELRGEGKHSWKGGPFPQNKKFVGYQY